MNQNETKSYFKSYYWRDLKQRVPETQVTARGWGFCSLLLVSWPWRQSLQRKQAHRNQVYFHPLRSVEAPGRKQANLNQAWVIPTYFYEMLMNYAWVFLHIKWCEDMSESLCSGNKSEPIKTRLSSRDDKAWQCWAFSLAALPKHPSL